MGCTLDLIFAVSARGTLEDNSGSSDGGDRFLHALKTLLQRAAGAAEIDANIMALGCPKECTVAQPYAMRFEVGDGILETKLPHIQPCQVSGFDGCFDRYSGKFAGDEIEQQISIAS